MSDKLVLSYLKPAALNCIEQPIQHCQQAKHQLFKARKDVSFFTRKIND
jgi:hypothetical protein